MIKVIKPSLGETLYDGACGSAGFLCESHDYLRYDENGKEKKSLACVIAIMNLILHGIDTPSIIHTNTPTVHNLNRLLDKPGDQGF